MPDRSQTTARRPRPWRGHILVMPTYNPGDLPPEGYLQWHEWAEVQRKAKIKQVECPTCAKWRTPQELSTLVIKWTVQNRLGQTFERSAFRCAECFERDAENAEV